MFACLEFSATVAGKQQPPSCHRLNWLVAWRSRRLDRCGLGVSTRASPRTIADMKNDWKTIFPPAKTSLECEVPGTMAGTIAI
jgi:hypothetical protein